MMDYRIVAKYIKENSIAFELEVDYSDKH